MVIRLNQRRQSAFIDLYEANRRDFSTIHQECPDAHDLINEIADFMRETETTTEKELEQRRQRNVALWNTLSVWLKG